MTASNLSRTFNLPKFGICTGSFNGPRFSCRFSAVGQSSEELTPATWIVQTSPLPLAASPSYPFHSEPLILVSVDVCSQS